jgi:hypothetical protein
MKHEQGAKRPPVPMSLEAEGGTGSKCKRIAIPRTVVMVWGAWNLLMGKGKRDAAAHGGGSAEGSGSASTPTQLQAAAARAVEVSSSPRPATELGPAGGEVTAGSSGGMLTALLPRRYYFITCQEERPFHKARKTQTAAATAAAVGYRAGVEAGLEWSWVPTILAGPMYGI